jgi:hypothetical protein
MANKPSNSSDSMRGVLGTVISPRFLGSSRRVTVAILLASLSGVAAAHHSFAMFDANKSVTVSGAVKDFQWGNPHVWLDITAVLPDGASKAVSLELNGISGLVRAGWKPATLKPGDRIKVTYHPLRDGSPGGQLVEVVTASGAVLKGQ